MSTLPDGLPVPVDDGAADHLPGRALPALTLTATSGAPVLLSGLAPGRTVVYLYPRTAAPGEAVPAEWDALPGARGCTAEACEFRDHHRDLLAAGAAAVYGLSTQDPDFQREAAARLHLPFALLSDPDRRLGAALDLPTFEFAGRILYRRLTLVVRDGRIEHVFHPVFPPDAHPREVLDWLRRNPS